MNSYPAILCWEDTLRVCKFVGALTIGVATDDLGTAILATAAAPVNSKITVETFFLHIRFMPLLLD